MVSTAVAMVCAVYRRSVSGEPRGPLCGMGICFECRVTIDGREHCRSCQVPAAEGMEVRRARMPERLRHRSVGAGPAGLAAACRAAEAGRRVAVVDDNPRPGGQIWRAGLTGIAPEAAAWLIDAVTWISGTRVVAAPEAGRLTLEETDIDLPAPDSGDGRARTLFAVPRLDAAQRDGRGRATSPGQIGPARRGQARGDSRQRTAAAGGGEIHARARRKVRLIAEQATIPR